MPSASAASRTRNPLRAQDRAGRRRPATPSIAARSGSRGSKYGSGWATRMSLTPRHRRGVRSSVQTTIEMTRTTSAALNHGERKTANSDSRSMTSTTVAPEDRVVAGVELVHRAGVVGRGAEREVGQLLDGHPDDREEQQEDDLEHGEIDRREQVPQAVSQAGAGCSGRTVGFWPSRRRPGSRWLRPLDGAERRDGPPVERASRRERVARSRPGGPRGPRARPRPAGGRA